MFANEPLREYDPGPGEPLVPNNIDGPLSINIVIARSRIEVCLTK
jgi:hypothetical protein